MSHLDELRIGGSARIDQITDQDEISVRLMEMGLVPGIEVKLVGVAPLGDPLELELRGYRLSVRRSEAHRVKITLL